MAEEIINQGIQAAQAGDTALAQKLLVEAVRQYPQSSRAWLWLGKVLEDPEKKKYCQDRALKLSLGLSRDPVPQPTPAEPASTPAAPPAVPAPPPSAPPPPTDESIPDPALAEPVHPAPPEKKVSPITIVGLLLSAFLLIFLCISAWSMITRGRLTSLNALLGIRPSPIEETQTYESLGFQVTAARDALEVSQYEDCIRYYDDLLAQMPFWSIGYYNRGICKRTASQNTNFLKEYEDHLKSAIKDQDRAIALEPDYSNAYVERAIDYINLTQTVDNLADQAVLLNIAQDNIQAAMALNTSHPAAQFQRVVIPLRLGNCAEGLDEGYRQINQTGSGRPKAMLYRALAFGHMCLGEYSDALAAVDNSRAIMDTEDINSLDAKILIGLGDLDAAFDILSQSIQENPDFNGDRYYLRAFIYYEWGNYDLARQDLAAGSGNTWDHGGLYAYLTGMLELQNGNEQGAKKWIAEAAATVNGDESLWLMDSIKEQLTRLNVKYSEPKPKFRWKTTPIPDS